MSKPVLRLPPWATLPSTSSITALLRDAPVILAALSLFYATISLARYWGGTVNTQPVIDLHPSALPKYAMFSIARIGIAYILSLLLTLVYAYIAAHNARAEKILIPLLDTLQSIPVLSFLPGVMVSMVALFPTRQLGVELGAILLILTGQVWNMTFSVYSSMKNIPREMLEAASIYRLSWWQKFTQLELPYSVIGLVWNSMMSVAGAWFFLMACEMFVLGNRDLRLPGLGSYLQTASNAGDTRAIVWGLGVMIAVIVMMDQLIWRPVIAWSSKFKMEQVEASQLPKSPMLALLRGSKLISKVWKPVVGSAQESLAMHFAKTEAARKPVAASGGRKWIAVVVSAIAIFGISFAILKMFATLSGLSRDDVRSILTGAGATFLRVELTLVLAAMWTVPAGVMIGLRPKLSAIAQPLAQIAASVPATALFPHRHAIPDSRWRRIGNRIHRPAAAGHAMVHPF